MTVFIIYSTNSGSTGAAGGQIAEILKTHSHSVTLKEAREVKSEELMNFTVIVLGTPSWDYEGLEGQPHEDMKNFLESIKNNELKEKKVAIFGLGDTSYTHFCGAVEILEQKVTILGGAIISPSLMVDRYYSSVDAIPRVASWGEKLAASLI